MCDGTGEASARTHPHENVKLFARSSVGDDHAYKHRSLNELNGWRRGWDSECFPVLKAKNLAETSILHIRQIRTKAEIETRIEHAELKRFSPGPQLKQDGPAVDDKALTARGETVRGWVSSLPRWAANPKRAGGLRHGRWACRLTLQAPAGPAAVL